MNVLLLSFLGVVSHTGLVYCVPNCSELKTCSECIGHASERCVWCAMNTMKNITELSARCQPQSEVYKDSILNTEWCLSNYINNPESKKYEPIENREFSATKGDEVQFRPQKMKLTLRPGVPVTVDMSYKPAEQFPLDMYFLMDSSYTMIKYATELADQTMKIYNMLTELSNNVHLGIGSFVEKPALPYADPNYRFHNTCHVFKNHLPLTNNQTHFQQIVRTYRNKNDANYDSPEAGLDALMQVMTCDEILWRSADKTGVQARRIIILASDATYHSAGDGKIVGAYKPNDMKCHLGNEKSFLSLDYPSVSQINYVANEGKFIIVFAVLNDVMEPYTVLIKEIAGAQVVKLQDNEIIGLIKNAYISASRNVRLVKNGGGKYIKIETNCDERDQCISSEKKPEVNIQATITAMGCTKNVSEIEIYPFGISDKLTIQVTIDCKCPCEIDEDSSKDCNLHGKKQCGICECKNEWSGDTCEIECSAKMASETKKLCKKQELDNSLCNGQGDCVCGHCQCYNTNNSSFSGKYCEFNDALCRKKCPIGKGDCVQGKCKCKDPTKWTGIHCDCPTSEKACIGPFYGEPCSGRGVCNCGQCKCNSQNGYYGKYCDSCKDCAKELCELLKDYALCNYEKEAKADCDAKFNQTSVKTVTIMNTTALEAETSATGCRKTLENGKIIVYKYRIVTGDDTETDQIELMIQEELDQPPVADIWITIGCVIGGVLLIGLLTLIIWKILTNMYDKREYDKFCREATDAGFDVSNPVYQDPNVNFVNPAYCETK